MVTSKDNKNTAGPSPINPNDDGRTHINIYSQARTELGRFLSHFTYSPIVLPEGRFNSIEGYWYWLGTKDDNLRHLYGFEAKKYGKSVRGECGFMLDEDFILKIKAANCIKLAGNPRMLKIFQSSTLPFKHYYVYGGKAVETKDSEWLTDFWENLRIALK